MYESAKLKRNPAAAEPAKAILKAYDAISVRKRPLWESFPEQP